MSSTSILPQSRMVYSNVLDCFSPSTTDVSHISSEKQIYNPIGNIEDSLPLDIIIPPTRENYTSLYESQLLVTFKITKLNGDNLVAADKICLNSSPFHSLFSDVEIFLNGVATNSCTSLNHYTGYLTNYLYYTPDQRTKDLSAQLFIKNLSESLDETDAAYNERMEYTAGSKLVQLCGRLPDAVCQENRHIPSGVEIHIRLKKNATEFILESKTIASPYPYKIKYENIQFICQRYLPHQDIVAHHNALFRQGRKMNFPLTLISIKTFPVQSNTNGVISSNLFAGSLP